MAIGQDLTSVPDSPGSVQDAFSMHPGWFDSRWSWVLPRHQSFMVSMIFASAADNSIEGSLDEVTHTLLGGDFAGMFEDLEDGWDAPVRWLYDEDFEDPEDGETEEGLRAAAAEHQTLCERMLRTAGAPVPATLRELADAMVALGIASQSAGHWSMPEQLPRPEDVLTMPAEMDAEFRASRHRHALAPFRDAVLRHLADDLGRPEEVFTSLDRVSRATQLDISTLQSALDSLIAGGEARLYRGKPRVPVAARDLEGHTRFHLVPDWETYSEDRLHIVRAD